MPIFFNANYNGVALLGGRYGLGKSIMEAAIKYGMYAVADYWHKKILPRHFERGAKRRYKHQPRKRRYSEIKVKLAHGGSVPDPVTGKPVFAEVVKGGLVDIAFEGSTETKAERNRTIRVSRNGFVMKMIVPAYIVQRRKTSYPNMKRELSTVTVEEAMLLGRIFWRAAKQFLVANKVNHNSSSAAAVA